MFSYMSMLFFHSTDSTLVICMIEFNSSFSWYEAALIVYPKLIIPLALEYLIIIRQETMGGDSNLIDSCPLHE